MCKLVCTVLYASVPKLLPKPEQVHLKLNQISPHYSATPLPYSLRPLLKVPSYDFILASWTAKGVDFTNREMHEELFIKLVFPEHSYLVFADMLKVTNIYISGTYFV